MDDDDFTVYPFRRQLVEETMLIEPVSAAPARPHRRPPPQPAVVRAARPRPSPLRWAVPAAVAAFLVAIAGAATISHPQEVQHAIRKQLVPAAAEAAPKPQRRKLAAPRQLFVPDVTGLRAARAAKLLRQSRFRPHVKRVFGKPGLVLEQVPRAATEVKRAGTVLLLVGKAKPKAEPLVTPTVIVTSVVGLSREDAVRALANEGLRARIHGVPSAQPAGTVVAQAPRSGSRADAGSTARINVAVG